MTERDEARDVLEEAREALDDPSNLDLALNPEPLVARLADALAQSRAEVEKLRVAVDDATAFYHQALEERDESRAEVERLRGQVGAFIGHSAAASRTADRAIAERDEALAAIERLLAEVERMTGDVTHWHGLWRDTVATADQWAAERDAALAAIERVQAWYGTVRYALTPHQQREFDRALDGGDQR